MTMDTKPTTFSAETYFATQAPPPTLDQDVQNVRSFIQRQAEEGRRVVLVTVCKKLSSLDFFFSGSHLQSGGTTVPLELSV